MIIKTTHSPDLAVGADALIPKLPLASDILREIEDKDVWKKTLEASRALEGLRGTAKTMPNENILTSTLSLQEAKDSSAIENIITSHDDLYRGDIDNGKFASAATKEVHAYAVAMREGVVKVKETGLLNNRLILQMQETIEENNAGFRTQGGTVLKNPQTNEIVYRPPQDPAVILDYMQNLEAFINDETMSDLDPIIKMAVIHHQFESIHPFFDGNGRTGRIINILYLVQQGLLDTPILYLSRYINQNKADYYRLLQTVRTEGTWKEWVLFMLEGVRQTSLQTTVLIHDIKTLMQNHKAKMQEGAGKIYTHELINHLFSYPYTKRAFVKQELGIHTNTAERHLDMLVRIGLLSKHKLGRSNYFFNDDLIELLLQVGTRRLEDMDL